MYEMILRSWKTLNEMMGELREDQLRDLIEIEQNHKGRKDVLLRLHQRYSMLRMKRERVELGLE